MTLEPASANLLQLTLFDIQDTNSTAFELFPKVWAAAEALADSQGEVRLSGLACLEELKAARYSPLISYLLFNLLTDPDLCIRVRVIRLLAEALNSDAEGQFALENVRQVLLYHLGHIRKGQIYALLEAAVADASVEPAIAHLLKNNCLAGDDLAEILSDRKTPLAIRERAASFIGRVGFVDATPSVERLVARLELRANGQQAFSFNQADMLDETYLLPGLKELLSTLQAP